jgi:F-type H+-transporting ATPase subunit epsilon
VDVSIVASDKKVWQGPGDLVIARSPEGEFGIMSGHIPFLAALVPGRVTVVSGSSRQTFLVTGGFLEASGPHSDEYHVIVLADDVEEVGEMDDAAIQAKVKEMQDDKRKDAELAASMAKTERESGEYSSR